MPDLRNKTARLRLPPRGALYTQVLAEGRALGYRRRSKDAPGKWILRMAKPAGGYGFETLGTADDEADANDKDNLSYAQALDAALGRSRADPTKITVAEALEDWADAKVPAASSPKQILDLRSTARRIGEAFPKATLNSITARQITAWIAADTKAARATANRRLATLKAALTRAADLHGYEGPRAWLSVKKFDKASSFGSRPVILTEDEEERLIAAAEPATAKLLRALQLTGARFGELRQVLVGDLEGTRLEITAGKTGPRVITLSPEKAEWFRLLAGNRPRREHLLLREDGRRGRTAAS
jgi:integrase